MNNITKMMAAMAVFVAVFGCMVIASDDSEAATVADIGIPNPDANPADGTPIFSVGSETFTDLTAALESAMDTGETLTLLRDYTYTPNDPEQDTIGIISDVTIDLRGHTLAFFFISTGEGATLTISNGTLYGKSADGTIGDVALISANAGCTVILDDVDYYAYGTGIIAVGEGATAIVRNGSVIHALGFYVSTNATPGNYNVRISIENSGIYADSADQSAGSAILFNVPGILSIADSTVQGYFHGVIVRGGTAVITGSTITNTMNSDKFADYFDTNLWGQGNTVPISALTIGNKGSSYQYPSEVTLRDTTVTSNGTAAAYYPAMYVNANIAEDCGVSLSYDSECEFSNGTDSPVEYDSNGENIVHGAPVASIGDRDFPTLEAAVSASGSGDTITLNDDITESITVPSGKNVTIDLNGHTLRNADSAQNNGSTLGNHTITVEKGATLTVRDTSTEGTGTVDCLTHARAAVYNLGTFTLESGTLTRSAEASKSPTDNGGNSWYVVFNGGDMTFDGGYVHQNGFLSSLVINRSVDGSEATMTINGGKFEQPNFIVIKNEVSMTITDGEFIGTNEQSVQNWGDAKIGDGDFYGNLTSITMGNGDGATESAMDITGGNIVGDVIAWNYHTTDTSADNSPKITIGGDTSVEGSLRVWSGTSNQETESDDAVIEVSGGRFSQEVDDRFLAPGVTMTQNPDGTYGAVESVTITFVDTDGNTLKQVDIPKGSSVPAEEIPAFGTAPEHYAYQWNSPVDQPFYDDFTVTAGLMISDLEVTVEIDGSTAVAVIDTPVEYTGAEYYWLYNDGSDEPNVIGMEDTQTLDADGQYALLVEIVDADGISGTALFEFEYTAESDLPPFIPFPPEQGGDPVEVYPSGDSGSSSDDGDGTLKVVAVAAAAVIAAILAIVLASTYRKD